MTLHCMFLARDNFINTKKQKAAVENDISRQLFVLFSVLTYSPIHGEHVDSRYAHEIINNSRKHAGFPKNRGYKVKLEEPDQSPYNRSDDRESQSDIINTFHK